MTQRRDSRSWNENNEEVDDLVGSSFSSSLGISSTSETGDTENFDSEIIVFVIHFFYFIKSDMKFRMSDQPRYSD